MANTRKSPFFARFRLVLIILMLVCFETFPKVHLIFTCQPKSPRGSQKKVALEKSTVEVTGVFLDTPPTQTNKAHYEDSSESELRSDVIQHAAGDQSDADAEYDGKPHREKEQMGQSRDTAVCDGRNEEDGSCHMPESSVHVAYSPAIPKSRIRVENIHGGKMLNCTSRARADSAWICSDVDAEGEGLTDSNNIPDADCSFFAQDGSESLKHSDVNSRYLVGVFSKGVHEPGNLSGTSAPPAQREEITPNKQTNTTHALTPVPCSCRTWHSLESINQSFTSCSLRRKTTFLLVKRLLHSSSTIPQTSMAQSGKRSQKLQFTAWNVDLSPNLRGQKKRNELSLQHRRMGMKPNRSGEHKSRHVMDLLFMPDPQPHGAKERNKNCILQQVLVFLALWVLLLKDQRREKVTGLTKNRLLHLVGQSAMDNWTTMAKNLHWLSPSFSNDSSNVKEGSSRYIGIIHRDTNKVCERKNELKSRSADHLPKSMPERESALGFFVQQMSFLVAPATSFLPTIDSPDTQQLDYAGFRLASLALLPPSCPLSRVRLADAGFHYNPRANPSAVVCHRCGAALSWESSSDPSSSLPPASSDPDPSLPPLAFHQATSPDCSFLTAVLERYIDAPVLSSPSIAHSPDPQSPAPSASPSPSVLPSSARLVDSSGETGGRDLWEDCDGRRPSDRRDMATGTQPSTLHQATTGDKIALAGSSVDQTTSSQLSAGWSVYHVPPADGIPQTLGTIEERPRLELGQAVYPQFSTLQSREATYTHWPLMAIFPPRMLATLGFYYAGYADCVRCFYCGVGLKSWEATDDVLKEHIRWRPRCTFLLATAGRQYVQKVLDSLESATNSTTTNQSLSTPSTHGTAAVSPRTLLPSSVGVPGSPDVDENSWVRQQLLTMGFSAEVISRAQTVLSRTGKTNTLDNMLDSISHLT